MCWTSSCLHRLAPQRQHTLRQKSHHSPYCSSSHTLPQVCHCAGTLRSCDPDRVVLKKIVLSGYPVKVHKKKAVVRWMFHNPEDVRWFKPLELWTKYGRRGDNKCRLQCWLVQLSMAEVRQRKTSQVSTSKVEPSYMHRSSQHFSPSAADACCRLS